MTFPIEEYYKQQRVSRDSAQLLAEAVACYKANAHRAAFLFSYLSYLNVLKERMLIADAPAGIDTGYWQNIHKNLRNDEKWEEEIITATQNKKHLIFGVTDDLRKQVEYWKYRRNDCVHLKSTEFTHALVETFWAFIQHSLPRLVVSGSQASLLNQLVKHYDITRTPKGADPRQLITQIGDAVEKDRLPEFFQAIHGALKQLRVKPYPFFNEVFSVASAPVQEALTEFMGKHERFQMAMLRYNPQHVLRLNEESKIRNIWYEQLFSTAHNDFPLYCALLRNNLIGADFLAEAHSVVMSKPLEYVPSREEFGTLHAYGFYEVLHAQIFTEEKIRNLEWANNHADLITHYVEYMPFTEEVVGRICRVFNRSFRPYSVERRLQDFFAFNKTRREEFLTVASTIKGLALPEYIPILKHAYVKPTTEAVPPPAPLQSVTLDDSIKDA